jgi:hypothetical protein
MYKIKIYVIILILCGFNLFGQNIQIWPEIVGLEEITISALNSREISSSGEYYKIYNNGTVDIVGYRLINFYGNMTFNVGDGTIIGTNVGEWGGELFFRSIYGGSTTYTIIRDNVVEIFRYKGSVYVLTGLSHLSVSRGKLVKLIYAEERWVVDLTIELDSCPYVYTIFDNYLYIVTNNGITIFDGNNIIEIISGNLRFFMPQSIYINNEIIAIGLRGCLAIVNKRNNNIRYYKK